MWGEGLESACWKIGGGGRGRGGDERCVGVGEKMMILNGFGMATGGESHLFILSSTRPMSEEEEEWRNRLDELLRPRWVSLHM